MFRTRVDAPMIQGWVAPGFEEIEAAFRDNFERRREVGAACAIYHKGNKVVDLWGGYRDYHARAPWQEDTLILVFSVTKGFAAITVAVAQKPHGSQQLQQARFSLRRNTLSEWDRPSAKYGQVVQRLCFRWTRAQSEERNYRCIDQTTELAI